MACSGSSSSSSSRACAGGGLPVRSGSRRCTLVLVPAPSSGTLRPPQLSRRAAVMLRSRLAVPGLLWSSRKIAGRVCWDAGLAPVSALRGPSAAGHVSGEAAPGSRSVLEPPQLSHLDGKLKVVGLGARGAAAVGRLLGGGRLAGAELWVLDTEHHQLPGATSILLKPDQGECLRAEDVARVVGEGAADKDGKGNVNVGDGGVAFLLASTGNLPGGTLMVGRLARELRAAGHFTVAALTRPFAFEGPRKLEAAAKLIAELEQVAHLVVVVEQDVLSQPFGGEAMTLAEATLIADNSLEHTVRCILDALLASEILKSTKGALIWHGKDLRHYRRLLSPPLQRLLSCPGTAALGRGVAVMPATSVRQMGAASALMHLASDAVRAAAESPFLESSIGCASAVLCCLSLPPATAQRPADSTGSAKSSSQGTFDGERHAARMAVQAAAGALMSLTAGACDDIVMSSHQRQRGDCVDDDDCISTRVEVSMLVMRLPEGAALPGTPHSVPLTAVSSLVAAPRGSSGHGQPPVMVSSTPPRRPSSDWSAMSALAGGAVSSRAKAAAPLAAQIAIVVDAKDLRPEPITPVAPAFLHPPRGQPAAPAGLSQADSRRSASRQAPPGGRRSSRPEAAPIEKELLLGYCLAEAPTAQSLDLPPQAAAWRQQQRGAVHQQRKLIVWEAAVSVSMGAEEVTAGLAGGLRGLLSGARREPLHVRERTSGILQADRSESWDENDT